MLAVLLVCSVFLLLITLGVYRLMSELDALKAQVAASVSSMTAATAAVTALRAEVASASVGKADLVQMATDLKTASDALSAAVNPPAP